MIRIPRALSVLDFHCFGLPVCNFYWSFQWFELLVRPCYWFFQCVGLLVCYIYWFFQCFKLHVCCFSCFFQCFKLLVGHLYWFFQCFGLLVCHFYWFFQCFRVSFRSQKHWKHQKSRKSMIVKLCPGATPPPGDSLKIMVFMVFIGFSNVSAFQKPKTMEKPIKTINTMIW